MSRPCAGARGLGLEMGLGLRPRIGARTTVRDKSSSVQGRIRAGFWDGNGARIRAGARGPESRVGQ